MRAAVAACNAEIDEQLSDRLRRHRRSSVSVQGELITLDAVRGEGVGDECFGQLTGLGRRHHPPHHVAGEDVDDHEQLVVDAAVGALQLGDIPRPNLVRSAGDQLGLLARRMGALAAPFPVLPGDSEQPIHRGDRAQVDAVIEQPGPHLGGGQIAVLRRAQHRQHPLTFLLGQLVRRCRTWRRRPAHRWAAPPVARRTRHAQQPTRPHGRVTASSSSKCASVIASTSDRCPRSRRVLPRARAVFP